MKKEFTRALLLLGLLGLILGGIPAQAALGDCPKGGDPVRCDAESGDAEAQYELGFKLLNGEGIPEDRMEALRWFSKASDQGHSSATKILMQLSLSSEPGAGCEGG